MRDSPVGSSLAITHLSDQGTNVGGWKIDIRKQAQKLVLIDTLDMHFCLCLCLRFLGAKNQKFGVMDYWTVQLTLTLLATVQILVLLLLIDSFYSKISADLFSEQFVMS